MVESKADTFSALIGKKIHICRVQADLSLRALGAKINVDNSTLAKIEKGAVRATLDVLDRAAQALQVHISYFVDPELQAAPLLGEVSRGGWVKSDPMFSANKLKFLVFPKLVPSPTAAFILGSGWLICSDQMAEFHPTDHEKCFIVQREQANRRYELARRQFEWFDPEAGTEGYPPDKLTIDIHTNTRSADAWLISEKGNPNERVIQADHGTIKRVWRVIQETRYAR